MTLVLEADRWDSLLRRLDQLFRLLDPEVERWMNEQPRHLVDDARFHHFVALVERFGDLSKSVAWVGENFGRTSGLELPTCVLEAAVTLTGMSVAARSAAPHAGDWNAPRHVAKAFLALWSCGILCRSDVTAPQVAAAYLWGGWSPHGGQSSGARWEPAGLAVLAMIYKSFRQGMHRLAGLGVPPLATEWRERRASFDERVVKGTHAVAGCLAYRDGVGPGADTLRAWDCRERNLWEFLSNVVLGSGRAGHPHGARPQAGAFGQSLLGRWASSTMGVTVGDVEVYVCTSCARVHLEPACQANPAAALQATWRVKQFVTPRNLLRGADRRLGHEQVQRKVCKNPRCVEALHGRLGRCLAATRFRQEPLFRLELETCPYCGCHGTAGQRPRAVWSRFP